ncbi:hypothetical protein [Citrobacter braakii]|uniref:hypothetical protein n=1 Tax=Citrobacter braakii TaxID=57706 RepID=UPI0039763914
MFGRISLTTKSLSSLQLDTSNPRLLGYKKQGKLQTEKEIITLMMTRYNIRELVNSILANGFYPDEVLYAIPDKERPNKKIIVEGNRRLTACKIIQKPSLLKGTPFSYLITKIERHPNYGLAVETIKKLHLIELSSRSEARTYIASKHTKESIKKWSVYTQGAYYIDLLLEFHDINALRASINNSVATTRIKGVILFTRLTDQILTLPTLSTEEKESLLNDIDNIKTEAVFRLIQRKDFRDDIAKINLSSEGEIIVKNISNTAYNHVLARLARDANFTKKLSTRQENEKDISDYLKELKSIKYQFTTPEDVYLTDDNEHDEIVFDLSGDDVDEDDERDLNEQESQNDDFSSIPTSPKIKTVKRKQPVSLLKKMTPLTNIHNKIDELILEARTLNCFKYKHSAILLSRTLLQVTMSHIIKSSDLHDHYMAEANRKHAYLELDNLLGYFSNNLKGIFPNESDESMYKLIRSELNSYKDTGKTIANLVTHNDIHPLTLQEVTHAQVKLQSLMDYFLGKIISGHRAA